MLNIGPQLDHRTNPIGLLHGAVAWTLAGILVAASSQSAVSAITAPTDIANLQLWLDATDATTVTLSGSNVTQWTDKSGNSRNFSQGTVANQPLYRTDNFTYKSAVDFDGTNDLLSLVAGPTKPLAAGDDTFTYFIVWKPDIKRNFEAVYEQGSIGTSTRAGFMADVNNYGFTGGSNDARTVGYNRRDWRISSMQINAGSGTGMRVVDSSTTNAPTVVTNASPLAALNITTTAANIAANAAGTEIFDGRIAEILVYSDTLTNAQSDDVTAYLGQKHNLRAATNFEKTGIDAIRHRYSFSTGANQLKDSVGNSDLGVAVGTTGVNAVFASDKVTLSGTVNLAAYPMESALREKTLVTWVANSSLAQAGGGSPLGVEQNGGQFDAIVYDEVVHTNDNNWEAGSNSFLRTDLTNPGPASETSTGEIMLAISYASDNSIKIYREGVLYHSYTKGTLFTFNDAGINIGRRVSGATPSFQGTLNEARIYGDDLSATDIALLYELGPDLAAEVAEPTTAYWRGDVNGLWRQRVAANTNWATSAAGTTDTQRKPGATTDVFFNTSGAGNLSTNLTENFSVKSLTFTNGASPVTISGASTLTIGTGGVTVDSGSGAHTISTPVILGATQSWSNNSARLLTVNGSISSGANTLSVGGSGNTTIGGAIGGGAGGLAKSGNGALTLGAANTYTGPTNVTAGTLAYGIANAINTGDVTVNGATAVLSLGAFNDSVGIVTLDGGGQITSSTGVLTSTGSFEMKSGSVSARLAGGVALNKTTTGTVTLSGTNTYSGVTNLNGGKLKVNGSHNGGGLYTVNTTATLGGSGSIDAAVLINSGGTISPGNSPGTFATGSETWNGGGNFLFEINDVDAGAGSDPGWDLLSITGTLTINATSGNEFNILLTSQLLTPADTGGDVHDFDKFSSYDWLFVDAGATISPFNSNVFTIVDNFTNDTTGTLLNGAFSVIRGDAVSGGNNTQLYIHYQAAEDINTIPEPSAHVLCLVGIAGLSILAWRRRR